MKAKSFVARILLALAIAAAAAACVKFDDSGIQSELSDIKSRLSALEQKANTEIAGLWEIVNALKNSITISSIGETDDAWIIIFNNGKTATLSKGGAGSTPVVGVRQDTDGIYYWTLHGQWMLDSGGKKLPVSGTPGQSPQLKIEGGDWYVSTDGGKTWTKLGKATGEDGDAFFKDVTWDDDYVYLTLQNDTKFELRRGDGLVASIAAIPDYSDGSVKAGTGLFTIRFKVEPESAAKNLLHLDAKCFKLSAAYTQTKAAEGELITLPVHKRDVEDGILTITTTGEELAAEFAKGKIGVSAALFISDGVSLAVNSGYFPLYPKNEYKGHGYVDLGLESGNKFADTNLGAENPWEPGNYYAWGELKPKDTYDWSTYQWCDGTEDNITKYNKTDGLKSFADDAYNDDVVRQEWGGEWRTPTDEDWRELMDASKFKWTWTINSGTYGYEVTSKMPGHEGKSIFLPVTGFRDGIQQSGKTVGRYWSSSLSSKDHRQAANFYTSSTIYGAGSEERHLGMAIRPVIGKYEAKSIKGVSIVPGSLTLTVGMSRHLNVRLEPENADNPKVTWSSGNPGVATVAKDGTVTAVSLGEAVITAKTIDGGFTATCTVSVKDESELAPQAIDLGLPSGVKWASMNVGATSPDDPGDYFAWGETEPHYLPGHALDNPCTDWKPGKEGYRNSSYKWITSEYGGEYTKYCRNDKAMSFSVFNYEDDAARANWGGEWRTPTVVEMHELLDYCRWSFETENGNTFARGTSKINGNSIIIPAAGYRTYQSLKSYGKMATFMTTWLIARFHSYIISSVHTKTFGWTLNSRSEGAPVRPVLGKAKHIPATSIIPGETDIKLIVGETYQLSATVQPSNASPEQYLGWISADETIAEVDIINGLVTAVSPGVTEVEVVVWEAERYVSATVKVTVVPESKLDHDAVDLGLPSGVKWASVNVGATRPEEFGDYYAWGETEPYYQPGHAQDETCKDWRTGKEAGYDLKSYRWYDGTWTKYNIYSGYGKVDNKTSFKDYNYADDAARAKWAGEWRMPSKADWDELNDYCTWTWTEQTGVKGYLVSGSSGKSIFIPAAGNREYKDKVHPGEGYYYTSDLFVQSIANNPGFACRMQFDKNGRTTKNASGRFCGLSIRPVLGEPAPPPEPDYVDMGLSVKWAKFNVGAKSEEQFGDYFAWGETEPYYQDGYAYKLNALWKPGKETGYYWPSYQWCNGDYDSITKYYTDGITTLLPADDAATVNAGNDWRMPTFSDWEELKDPKKCYWDCTKVQGVPGYMVTSYKTGNSIFLPAAGFRDEEKISNTDDDGTIGYYWSSTRSADPWQACSLFFVDEKDGGGIFLHDNDRCKGYSVRPVTE
jgi:hypothetical protein